ncbi:hypothetical protein [uncultured Amphritea sp.]|uniref:hypothetical protein n=1 Tax=uncultured Amphritea sp. TaxID=981605 RepID=UPI002637A0B4|nr:hypothetical protein [uncultured Amphritea sp.]
MANRQQEDLKLIVGVEGSKTGNIPAHKPKEKIKGQRGIVYFNADGTSSSTTGNTPSTDEEGNKEEGTTQPDAGGTGAGTSGGNYNSGNKLEDTDLTAPYPVDDPTAPGAGIFSVDQMTLGDVVKGLSGLIDCATGDPVDVRFDGQFTAPDGWDSPDSHEVPAFDDDGTFVEGSLYHVGQALNGLPFYATAGDAYAADNWPASYRLFYYVGSWRAQYQNQFGDWANAQTYRLYNAAAYGLTDAYAALTTPTVATQWPAEKPMQLSRNPETGLFGTHPMDGNVTTAYAQPVSQVNLCDADGNPVGMYHQAGGGIAVWLPGDSHATFLDATGKVTGFGDGAAVTNNQPR